MSHFVHVFSVLFVPFFFLGGGGGNSLALSRGSLLFGLGKSLALFRGSLLIVGGH